MYSKSRVRLYSIKIWITGIKIRSHTERTENEKRLMMESSQKGKSFWDMFLTMLFFPECPE
jgi:hypothetical protein